MQFRMYDVVRLTRVTRGLAAGAEGTIVMAYEFPREGYEVEFDDRLLTLYPEDLELVTRWECGHAP